MDHRRESGLIRVDRGVGRLEHARPGEVVEQRPLIGIDDDAIGCQGPVGHATPVRVVQGARDLLEDPQARPQLDRPRAAEDAAERAALHVLRGAPQEIVGGAVPIDRDDVRVIELGRAGRRAVEATGPRSGQSSRHHLQGDRTVLAVAGQIDDLPGWRLEQAVDPEVAR